MRKEKFSGPGENCQRNVTDLAGSLVTSSRPPGRLQKRPDDRTSNAVSRYEHDSSTIRARFGYNTLQHATRFLCARIRDRLEHSTRISGRRDLYVD